MWHSYQHCYQDTPYPLGWKENHFILATLKLVPRLQMFYRILSRLATPYHTLSPRLERKQFYVGKFKISSQNLVVITSFLSIENSFPDCITRISSYHKYYQLLLHGKFPMNGKKMLVVGPPDSGKTSWFAPFQGMLTNSDFLFSSEKITVVIFWGILFNKTL